MDDEARKILLIGALDEVREHLSAVFQPPDFDLQHAASIGDATPLLQKTDYELLLVQYIEHGTTFAELMKTVRWSGSPCRNAAVAVFADPEHLEKAEELLDFGVSRIINPLASRQRIVSAVSEMVDHEPRYPVRALIRIPGEDLGHKGTLMTQTLNLSATGALVNLRKTVLMGSRFTFSLEPPGVSKPIRGLASVCRLTQSSSERTDGFAARFVSFEGDGQERLRRFLATQPKPDKDQT